MDELDFHGLRAAVEEATTLPEFATVRRRAGRIRARSRLSLAVAMLATVAVVVPASVLAAQGRGERAPTVMGIGPQPAATDTTDTRAIPTPAVPAQVTVLAAGGVSLDHLWVAVDVCLGQRCNLQISAVHAGRQPDGPALVGQLRRAPTDQLSGVTLAATGPDSVLVSGVVPGAGRQYARVDPTGTWPDGGPPAGPPGTARAGDAVFQLTEHGDLRVAEPGGRIRSLPSQPPVADPAVLTGLDPAEGIWVTGLAGPDAAIAVSHDGGVTWKVDNLGVPPDAGSPVIATADGRIAYAYLPVGTQVRQWRSRDGGASWQAVAASMPWPAAASPGGFGAVVRPDGSLLIWQAEPPAPVFLESTDAGASYHAVSGPGGPVVALPGGYVALGEHTALSRDARTWVPVTVPHLVIDN